MLPPALTASSRQRCGKASNRSGLGACVLRLKLNARNDTANQPTRLAHPDDGNDRAILIQSEEGSAQVVRLGHRGTPSLDTAKKSPSRRPPHSVFRFRDALSAPTAQPWLGSGVSGSSSNSRPTIPIGWSGRQLPPRGLIGPNSNEALKPLAIGRRSRISRLSKPLEPIYEVSVLHQRWGVFRRSMASVS